MSLRDKLRGVRGSSGDGGNDREGGTGGEAGENPSEASHPDPLSPDTDVRDFAPRHDGDYHCLDRGLYLRFARPAVTENDAAHDEPARGEYSTAGRFAVQRRFGRPVVYTVLDAGDLAADDAVLVVRRTDTGAGAASGAGDPGDAAERLEFPFEPDRS